MINKLEKANTEEVATLFSSKYGFTCAECLELVQNGMLDELENSYPYRTILMEDYHHSRNVGVVESLGNLVASVKVGDKVLFHKFDELPTPEADLVVVRENSILGVYEDE